MKQLLVMRHGKSDWSMPTSDRERPLNPRGVRAAETMGRVLTAMDLAPDLVLSSPANRARTTADLAAEAGSWSAPIVEAPAFYEAGVDASLERLSEVPDDVDRLLVTGHMPTWGALVHRIAGASVAMKTATVAVIHLHLGGWDGSLHGELYTLLQPRLVERLHHGDDG